VRCVRAEQNRRPLTGTTRDKQPDRKGKRGRGEGARGHQMRRLRVCWCVAVFCCCPPLCFDDACLAQGADDGSNKPPVRWSRNRNAHDSHVSVGKHQGRDSPPPCSPCCAAARQSTVAEHACSHCLAWAFCVLCTVVSSSCIPCRLPPRVSLASPSFFLVAATRARSHKQHEPTIQQSQQWGRQQRRGRPRIQRVTCCCSCVSLSCQ
jgi:hypothetical protein